jgi:hypothetical protein
MPALDRAVDGTAGVRHTPEVVKGEEAVLGGIPGRKVHQQADGVNGGDVREQAWEQLSHLNDVLRKTC